MRSLRTQTYFRLSLLSHDCEPEPGNDFCDVGILSQSQFSSSSPRATARGIHCEEHSSFILPWNLIDQRETKVITSQKSFPGSGSQRFFSAETNDSRKYVCVRRLVFAVSLSPLDCFDCHVTDTLQPGNPHWKLASGGAL